MKWTAGLIALALFGLWLSSDSFAQKESQNAGALETLPEKVSYSLGYQIGQNFGNDLQVGLLVKGFQDAQANAESLLTPQIMQQSLQDYQKQRQAREGEDNKAAGVAFLKANKEKEGVVSLPSGLQYKVMTKGSGPSPAATDTVTVHYHGTLIDGRVFDSSVDRGQPATFPLNRVIRGWTEGLQLMKVGGKWTFYIPSEMAYGPQRRSAVIGANSTLIFEVELLSIDGK
ncbi:MAG: FKBP-type peptidyl-prolyl cis-trans isomerase [Fuerstiella sp.]|nr:FKBP-type peptidyl-prolyl cis-trans isomerase [Fuerstiella sp.]